MLGVLAIKIKEHNMKSFAITSVPEEDGYAMYHTTVEATTPAAAVAKFYRLYGNKLTTEPVVATLEEVSA